MQVLIIRHAIAVPRGTPDIPDDERPLTRAGEKRFRSAARGLARIADRPDALLTSPLPRAARTAELAAKAWGKVSPTDTPALAGGELRDVLKAIEEHGADATVAVVGHEPQVSELLAQLVGSDKADRLTFRKGGAALVEVSGSVAEGGRLLWYLTPRILRELAED
jgi:phosphohistidine phosphatase